MKRFRDLSIATQFICLAVLALLLSQAISLLFSRDERDQAIRAAYREELMSRAETVARLIETTPPSLADDITRANNTLNTRYWVSAAEPADPAAWRKDAWARLVQPFSSTESAVAVARSIEAAFHWEIKENAAAQVTWITPAKGEWSFPRQAKIIGLDRTTPDRLDKANAIGLSVRLNQGNWLNIAFAKPWKERFWTSHAVSTFLTTAIVLSTILIIAIRGITRPMRRIAAAAEALGRGETVAPLPETGPRDVRHMAQAFNRMQERLQRFIADRTRMLAAIGHDLRTPITSLRLRAEFVNDGEIRDKMLGTIDEMQKMTEATLSFARADATVEETRSIDLAALIQSLADDLTDMGHDVVFTGGPKTSYRCRTEALRRALRNLIENATRYGERARIGMKLHADGIDIIIEDDGPGIPANLTEQVFMPFFRLEDSRSQETGGVGLGLSIARNIIRNHGGDIRLVNCEGGLQAIVTLPVIDMRGRLREAA